MSNMSVGQAFQPAEAYLRWSKYGRLESLPHGPGKAFELAVAYLRWSKYGRLKSLSHGPNLILPRVEYLKRKRRHPVCARSR